MSPFLVTNGLFWLLAWGVVVWAFLRPANQLDEIEGLALGVGVVGVVLSAIYLIVVFAWVLA